MIGLLCVIAPNAEWVLPRSMYMSLYAYQGVQAIDVRFSQDLQRHQKTVHGMVVGGFDKTYVCLVDGCRRGEKRKSSTHIEDTLSDLVLKPGLDSITLDLT